MYHLHMCLKHCLTLQLAHLVKRTCDLNYLSYGVQYQCIPAVCDLGMPQILQDFD